MATSSERANIQPQNDEVIIEIMSSPDSMGRQMFRAYWRADNIGPTCNQRGVRGQVFHTPVDHFTAREQRRGQRVTILDRS